jgi:hypothetical protein
MRGTRSADVAAHLSLPSEGRRAISSSWIVTLMAVILAVYGCSMGCVHGGGKWTRIDIRGHYPETSEPGSLMMRMLSEEGGLIYAFSISREGRAFGASTVNVDRLCVEEASPSAWEQVLRVPQLMNPLGRHAFSEQANARAFPEWADLLNDSVTWAISPDKAFLVRVSCEVSAQYIISKRIVELWRLDQRRTLSWRVELPGDDVCVLWFGEFIEIGGARCVLLCLSDQTFLLRQSDGSVLDSFGYAGGETESVGQQAEEEDSFSPFYFALDPAQDRLAAGGAQGTEVRVLSMRPPHRVIFKTGHTEKEPGFWGDRAVGGVRFLGEGRYLVAGYWFSSRLLGRKESLKMFETTSWSEIWGTDGVDARGIAITPDGKRMVVLRDGLLEVGTVPLLGGEQ